ncbi:MAG: glycosyltransferase family 39 protein [Acidobacteria bacterium]|nr:glycosyltransferase family 39 protein [Acidobacteriota bacterium]
MTAPHARDRTLFLLGLTVLLIVAAILRLHDLGLPAFDCDELYALRIRGVSLKEIASVVGRSAFHDLHPPLSYLLFLPWVALFGTAEAAVRSLPMLLGLVSVALLGLVGRRIGGVWVGLAGAAFLAFNPLHIAYSQEARPYALAVTLTIAAHLFFLRSLGEGAARDRIVYALLVVAAIYTHYFALFALLPHGLIALWLLLTGDADSRRAARPTLLAFACALATYIAWLPALVFQATGQPEGPSLRIYDAGGSPLGRAGGFMKNVAGLAAPPVLLSATAAMLVLLIFAFLWRQRLPAAAAEFDSRGLPPRWLGVLALLAGLLLAGGLPLLARHLVAPARQVLLAKGYGPGAVERELHGLLQFTVTLPLALGVIGLLVLVWPWLSSLPDRLPGRSSDRGRPLAINALLAALLLVPVTVVLALALKGVPLLSDRNLLVFEPALALVLGVGAVRLAQVRWGRVALVPVVLCLAIASFQYQPVSGVFGVRGTPLGIQTGAWRDLVRELDRRHEWDLPLVMVDAPRSDPAEFYLIAHPYKRFTETERIVRAGLPGEFRFVHLRGNRSSEALLSHLSGVVPLQPELQVDEFVIYDARTSRQP